MIGAPFTMANAVDRGVTHNWSSTLRSAWAIGLMALLLAGLLTLVVALGILSSQNLASIGERSERAPTVPQFIAVYVGFLVLSIGTAIYLEDRYGINGKKTIFVAGGTFFLIASSGRPWWLFATFRRLGWFAVIRNDHAMRLLLGGIGLILLLIGLTAHLGAA
jgi:hypothetical protein